MEKIAVVILNYLNYQDTIECIESLKNDVYENKEIIVVDNNSTNNSWEILNEKYKDDNIYFLKSEKNLGFAKGNNIGIKYARDVLKASFILLVNNDTIFNETKLLSEMINAYENDVAIIGPRIIEANGLEQNPVPIEVSKKVVEERYNKLMNPNLKDRIKNSNMYSKAKNKKVFKIIKKILVKQRENSYPSKEISPNICSKDLVLHGACMMLTKSYFEYYDKLFPETFLYYEENILTLLTKKVNLKKKFINNVAIFHKEDMSSMISFGNSDKVKQKYELDSVKKCIEIFELSYDEIIYKYFKSKKEH
ncbi:glycosyltransferase family 2 protein [Clostridium perfringens]|uniref:Glycosyltransferase n=1 Tax=Clostridium perfringens TaxID=1502 RepID=A0AAW9I4T0_CLOPF|nr:glycosyltransferase family 2 protein [Clostridium perfringens]MDM0929796.1 glycosyltransferase family 2 protein [Clostridium perfringens]MDM0953173.1 glycosyltransferase family 2 protein [Clostridium perfringens]MDZ4910119.1 glycosyltransferase [Clostridium perfringens]